MTSSASSPSTRVPQASACAWFPAEMPITPRSRSCGVSAARLVSTPRGLNEPVRWNSSAFSETRAPVSSLSVAEENVGVRCSRPPIASRAAWTSASSTTLGELVVRARAALRRGQPAAFGGDRAALDAVRGRHLDAVLDHLVDRRRAHARPQLGQLPRRLALHADVVRRVVARRVAREEDGRELVEGELAVGRRVALRAVGADQLLVGVALEGRVAVREGAARGG